MKNYAFIQKIIFHSKLVILMSFMGFIVSILVSYPYALNFSISTQILAHILTIIFAGCFKVSVVALMAATKEKSARIAKDNKGRELCFSIKP